jgi:hypothetical protein
VPIREATLDDVPAMLDLAAAKRTEHGEYQPVFWRPAAQAVVMQDLWFQFLLTSDDHHLLVAVDGDGDDSSIVGFLIAQIMDAPPVYDPGGRTCMVDDFVAAPGVAFDDLLAAARSWGSSRGAVQMVVVTAAADDAKRSALAANDLTVASEWWVGPA